MTEEAITAQVDEFKALPRKERREKYNSLPEEVQQAARSTIEARRGIAKRENGKIVHTKDVYIREIKRMAAKERDLKQRLENLPKRREALKAGLQAHYGDDALAEATQAVADQEAAIAGTSNE